MNNNLHKIFSESGCPSSVTLQAYLENTLSGKEKHLIEAHLIDCEMCSDELEGLSLLKGKEKLGDIVEEIKAQTVKKQAKVFHLNLRNRILAAAAVILLLTGLVFIIKNVLVTEEKNYITQRYEPGKISQKPVESMPIEKMEPLQKPEEEIRAIKKEKIADFQIEMEEEPGLAQIEDVVMDDEQFDIEIAIEEELIAVAENIEPVKKTDISITDNFATAQDTISLDVVSLKSPATTFASGKSEEDIVETAMHRKGLSAQRSKAITSEGGYVDGITTNNISDKDAMNKAMDKFNSKKFKAAIRNFNVALVFDPNNNNALYYLSLSYYELKEYENAIRNLDKILVSTKNEFYSKARFKKANILIIQKKNKEAKTLLLQIINENDEMKARAEQALKGIDN